MTHPLVAAGMALQQSTLSVAQVREVDRVAIEEYGMNSLVLMENAALGCVSWLRQKFSASSVASSAPSATILCGRGNNGGDGLAIARHLTFWGWQCQVIQLGPLEQLSADARHNYQLLTEQHGLPVAISQAVLTGPQRQQLQQSNVVVDAMLGTGAGGAPRPPLDDWIVAANDSSAFRIAIDLPTGIDADTGAQPGLAFHPHATLTFVGFKKSMSAAGSHPRFGEIHVLPIGIPAQLALRLLAEPA